MTGPCFNPNRDRLYFSSQRGPSNKQAIEVVPAYTDGGHYNAGVTYEISGPFRGRVIPPPPTTTAAPTTTLAKAVETAASVKDDKGSNGGVIGGVSAAVAAAVLAVVVAFRRRSTKEDPTE